MQFEDAPVDDFSCNSAICFDCAQKYYEYVQDSGEVVQGCVMCGQSLCMQDSSLINVSQEGLGYIEELDAE